MCTPLSLEVKNRLELHTDELTPLFLFVKTEKDILLRDELEEVKKNHPDKVKVWFTLDKPPQSKTFLQLLI